MQDSSFILLLIVTYSGLPAGLLISYLAREELPGIQRYLLIARPLAFSLAVFIFLDFMKMPIAVSILIAFFTSVFLYLLMRLSSNVNFDTLIYGFFAVAVFETRDSIGSVWQLGSLIFIYGLLAAAVERRNKAWATKALSHIADNSVYLILGMILLFVFT